MFRDDLEEGRREVNEPRPQHHGTRLLKKGNSQTCSV